MNLFFRQIVERELETFRKAVRHHKGERERDGAFIWMSRHWTSDSHMAGREEKERGGRWIKSLMAAMITALRICRCTKHVGTVPYEGDNFANSKMDKFSLIIDWLNFLKNNWNDFLCQCYKYGENASQSLSFDIFMSVSLFHYSTASIKPSSLLMNQKS